MADKWRSERSVALPIAGTLNECVSLLSRLAKASRSDFDELKRDADELTGLLERNRAVARDSPGRSRDRVRAVDEWILDIFRSTESALPRETLLQEFVARYRKERRTQDSDRHAGPWLFVFRRELVEGGRFEVRPESAVGVHPAAFSRLCDEHLPQADADPFLAPVLRDQQEIEGWHATWFGGSPLFDHLLAVVNRFGGESDYWVTGTPLSEGRAGCGLGVFVLYPNAGDLLAPEPPSTMRQDQRLSLALSLAWRQLEHQVKSLATLTEQGRRELLNLLAPGLLHHELGTTLRSLYGQAYEQFHLLQGAATQNSAEWLEAAVRYAHSMAKLALRGHHITDVFNNLDKRGQLEEMSLDKLLSDVQALLHHRLGAHGAELRWDQVQATAQTTLTDVVLIQQAVINIVLNALNALSESNTPAPRCVQVDIHATAHSLSLLISNNGPPIPSELSKDIFRRGYTTRAAGHGQGLYLVRLIAHYAGGEVTVVERSALPAGAFAGFRFQWQRRLAAQEGLARAVKED